jgi:hypothetical protein
MPSNYKLFFVSDFKEIDFVPAGVPNVARFEIASSTFIDFIIMHSQIVIRPIR